MIGNFHFIRPAWLLLLPIAVAIWWRIRRTKDPMAGWRNVMAEDLLQALVVGGTNRKDYRQHALLLAWILGCIAIAGPTWQLVPSPFADNPNPVMMLLKANETMKLTDLTPSRMERAKLKIVDFANVRKGLPLGLGTYAGSAHLVLPPTRDTSVVATMATEIGPDILPTPGEDLGTALQMAARTMGSEGGAIVVVADTVGNVRDDVAAELTASGIAMHFLAIAREDTPELEAINQAARQLNGNVTLMTADLSDVESLAKATAEKPVSINDSNESRRWAESGWWLVPILAIFSLASFQRIDRGES